VSAIAVALAELLVERDAAAARVAQLDTAITLLEQLEGGVLPSASAKPKRGGGGRPKPAPLAAPGREARARRGQAEGRQGRLQRLRQGRPQPAHVPEGQGRGGGRR